MQLPNARLGYLSQQFITSTHFKREPDAAAWNPTPCGAT
jgi:hypothetical protein